MATIFGHNSHHQAISQKLKKAGTYSAKSSVYMGSRLHLYYYTGRFIMFVITENIMKRPVCII